MESELGRRAESLRGREAEVAELGDEVQTLRRRLEASQAEAGDLRIELEDAKARAEEELRTMALLARQFEELRISARGAATRIRLCALREAAEVNARLSDASDPRGGEVRDRILDALERAIDRVGVQWEGESDLTAPPAPPLARSAAARVSLAGGQPAGAPRRRVSVDIGPFEDFSQLVRFEDAANSIGATGDISIKRFSGGRARIDVALSEPVDLLRELEENCDLEFKVRSRNGDEIVLDVEE